MTMTVTNKSRIVQVFSQAFLNPKKEQTETFKEDYKKSLEHIRELAQDYKNPQNQYELSQIMTYVIDSLIKFRTNYLDYIGDVQRTGYKERPQFKYRTQEVEAFWQAVATTADASRVGFAYEGLKTEALTAMPVAEWIEIADGRYDFGLLVEDVLNQFDIKIAQKVQGTLYSAMNGIGTTNYASGNGINQQVFDELLSAMMRFGGGCAIVGDFEALQKLPNLTGISGQVSDNIIDEFNRNGVIGTYKGAQVVKLVNPYVGLNGFDTALNRGYIYIVPNVRPDMKTLKLWFRGGISSVPMQQDIDDLSYKMRFDQLFGAGVVGVDKIRQPIAIYEDTTLSS